MKVRITRKTRNVGWGWRCWTPEHPEPPEIPDYVGTIGTVWDQIDQDRTYQSLRYNTYHTTRWFVKVNGSWYPLEQETFDNAVIGLYDRKEVFVDVP